MNVHAEAERPGWLAAWAEILASLFKRGGGRKHEIKTCGKSPYTETKVMHYRKSGVWTHIREAEEFMF